MSEIVREGYQEIAGTFDEWKRRIVDDPRQDWRADLERRLPDGARILELGCGSGEDARALALRFRVTGVDISSAQLAMANDVDVIEADFTELELPDASYDAVVSFYALNHVPRERLAPLLSRVARWLAPGGWFMAAFGVGDTEAWVGEWLGTTMFFSSWPRETNSTLVSEAGLSIVRDELVRLREPEGDVDFQWILARA